MDPRVPWYAKLVAALVAGYAFSPIDLIPDFIPVLGYLDDLLLVPLGVRWAVSLIPDDLLAEFREEARRAASEGAKKVSWTAGAIILAVWVLAVVWAVRLVVGLLRR
ncbi:MAG: YkvA family protein [Methanocella sp.]